MKLNWKLKLRRVGFIWTFFFPFCKLRKVIYDTLITASAPELCYTRETYLWTCRLLWLTNLDYAVDVVVRESSTNRISSNKREKKTVEIHTQLKRNTWAPAEPKHWGINCHSKCKLQIESKFDVKRKAWRRNVFN